MTDAAPAPCHLAGSLIKETYNLADYPTLMDAINADELPIELVLEWLHFRSMGRFFLVAQV